jgi:hypothetical protein
MCHVLLEVVDYQDRYCTNPIDVTIELNGEPSFTFDGDSYSLSNLQFSTVVTNRTYPIEYHRQILDCVARSTSLTLKTPATNMSVSVDTTGTWPVVVATGGYGQFSYMWDFDSNDLADLFGATIPVTVSDVDKCTQTLEVTVPESMVTAPVATSAPVAKNSLKGFKRRSNDQLRGRFRCLVGNFVNNAREYSLHFKFDTI